MYWVDWKTKICFIYEWSLKRDGRLKRRSVRKVQLYIIKSKNNGSVMNCKLVQLTYPKGAVKIPSNVNYTSPVSPQGVCVDLKLKGQRHGDFARVSTKLR